MKKSYQIALLLSSALLVVGINFASAQDRNETDYIINASGDTVRCQIKKTLFGNTVKYKTDKMPNYEEVDPHYVKQYYYHKDDFPYRLVTLDIEKKVLYLGLLEEGEINLFEQAVKYKSGNFGQGVNPATNYNSFNNVNPLANYTIIDWYIEKGLESPVYIKSNRVINAKSRSERKTDFISLISDKPTVLDEFKKDNDYSFDSIRDIVHLYNTGQRLKKD